MNPHPATWAFVLPPVLVLLLQGLSVPVAPELFLASVVVAMGGGFLLNRDMVLDGYDRAEADPWYRLRETHPAQHLIMAGLFASFVATATGLVEFNAQLQSLLTVAAIVANSIIYFLVKRG